MSDKSLFSLQWVPDMNLEASGAVKKDGKPGLTAGAKLGF